MKKAFKIFEKNKLKNELTSKVLGGRGGESCTAETTHRAGPYEGHKGFGDTRPDALIKSNGFTLSR